MSMESATVVRREEDCNELLGEILKYIFCIYYLMFSIQVPVCRTEIYWGQRSEEVKVAKRPGHDETIQLRATMTRSLNVSARI